MRGILDVRPDLAKAVLDQALLHLSHEDDSHGTAIKGVINIVTKVAEIKPTLISANMMRAITRRAHAADKYHELAEKLLPILDARPQLAVAVWAETQSFASGTEDNHHAYAFITKLFERYPALVTESRLRVMTKGVSAEVIDNDRHAFGAAMKAALSHKPELAKTIDEATPLRRVMGQLLPQPQPAGV
ncbi:MAG: hypothetical protein WAO98_08480 [Alphaproteobacteria bacterium]